MKPRDFLKKLDDAKIVRAIRDAERKTSGEIRVFITSRHLGNDSVVQRAASRFEKLGMTATRERNAVLLYFAPRANQFAIVGDNTVHEKCGDTLWREVASSVCQRLRDGNFTEAITLGIAVTGDALARHFPPQSDDRNELPNEIERD
jgi:uncharacterized membrane protein